MVLALLFMKFSAFYGIIKFSIGFTRTHPPPVLILSCMNPIRTQLSVLRQSNMLISLYLLYVMFAFPYHTAVNVRLA
jgi:hypothetical protein